MSHSPSLNDPPEASVLLAVAQWIEGVQRGDLATVIAVVAIASIGFAMLTGRMDLRRGGRIILGCFILFGASAIASGLRSAAQNREASYSNVAPAPPPVFIRPERTDAANRYDPYAGASVPQQ